MHYFAKILLALLAAAVLAFAGYFIIQQKREQKTARIAMAAREWSSLTLLGLTLDAPGEFKVEKLDLGATQELVEASEMGIFKTPQLEIDVLRTIYKPGVSLNFDGAVQGAIDGVSRLDGVRNVQQTMSELNVSGRPARRLSLTADRWQDRMRMEILFISDTAAYYQVQVIFLANDPRGAADADQIMKSVRIGR
jgi:hypothetical protein